MDKMSNFLNYMIPLTQSVGLFWIITILKLIAPSITIMKSLGWFQRKKSILIKQKEKKLTMLLQVFCDVMIGSLEVYLPLLSFLGVASIIMILFKVTFWMIHVFLIMCILFLFPSLFLMRYQEKKSFSILFGIISMILVDILGSLVIVTGSKEVVVYITMIILCVTNYALIKYYLINSGFVGKRCSGKFAWLKRVRDICSVLVLFMIIFNMAFGSNAFVSLIIYLYGGAWLIFYFLECYILWNEEKESFVTFFINLQGEVCETKDKILQYREDKVKFTTDKLERLVDSKEIQSISYRSTTYFKKKAKRRVVCYLKNGKRIWANKYKYLTDKWICFYVIKEDQYKATVINADAIKEILIKNKEE